jgi:hypothetical protein
LVIERIGEWLMTMLELIFGKTHKREITTPPRGVKFHEVRPREDQRPVRAWVADRDGDVRKPDGVLHYARGDYLVEHSAEDIAVVRKEVFDKMYRPIGGGEYVKRSDIVLRYFTLSHDVIVQTDEGPHEARAGDWIMCGLAGEIWPVDAEKAREKYERI